MYPANQTECNQSTSGHALLTSCLLPVVTMAMLVVYWCAIRNKKCKTWTSSSSAYDALPLPPGSMGLPVIGEMIAFILESPTGEFFHKRYRKYGPVFKTHILGGPSVHVMGGSKVKDILLGEHSHVSTMWPSAMRSLLGDGCLSMVTGDEHKNLRKCVTRSLKRDRIRDWRSVLSETIRQEVTSWGQSGHVDLYECAKRLTLRAAFRVFVGTDIRTDRQTDIEELAADFIAFGEGFFGLPLPIPGTAYHRAKQARQRIQRVVSRALKENHDVGYSTLLQMIRANFAGHATSRTETELENLMIELIFGGQETAAATITFAVYLLDKHPHTAEKLEQEVTSQSISQPEKGSQYVDDVIRETLRLFPPIGGGFRQTLKTLNIGGYRIPKGWTLTYSIKDSHHASASTTDPHIFDPERWRRDDLAHSPDGAASYEYIPFGAGARACVGREYAQLFLRELLSQLVTAYSFRVLDRNPVILSVPLVRPQDGLRVAFTARH